MNRDKPFDAVLIIGFGGPRGMADVRPFLQNVVRGRHVPPARLEAAVRRYEVFGGVSPLTEIILRQARGLEERLKHQGIPLPVHVGMRNWHPFIADTLTDIVDSGGRRILGFIATAHHSYSSCGQYKEGVSAARQALIQAGKPDVAVTYVDSWFDHDLFVRAWAEHAKNALSKLDRDLQDAARIVFTAHSIPVNAANTCKYREQLATSCQRIAEAMGQTDWALAYQSRSGRPEDAWLEPDVRDYLRAEHAKGLRAAVLVPIGFLCDHLEVLYDLDIEVAAICQELSLPMRRAEMLNDDPTFLDMMAAVVQQTYIRHRNGYPLPLCAPAAPLNRPKPHERPK